MPLLQGDNTVRVAGMRSGTQGIYDIYQFTVLNLRGETHGFCYAVPAGTRPPAIVLDLNELKRLNYWFVIYLKEVNGLLAIQTIKEPQMPQVQCWHIAQRIVKQSPRKLKELTNESLLVH